MGKRVAVVGSGISGLSAAWLLHRWAGKLVAGSAVACGQLGAAQAVYSTSQQSERWLREGDEKLCCRRRRRHSLAPLTLPSGACKQGGRQRDAL